MLLSTHLTHAQENGLNRKAITAAGSAIICASGAILASYVCYLQYKDYKCYQDMYNTYCITATLGCFLNRSKDAYTALSNAHPREHSAEQNEKLQNLAQHLSLGTIYYNKYSNKLRKERTAYDELSKAEVKKAYVALGVHTTVVGSAYVLTKLLLNKDKRSA